MARHRGTFNPSNDNPYEVSRGKVENFVRCPACFWLERAKGVKFPSMPGFNLNSNTDILLKRDFDVYRAKQEPHPIMEMYGLDHLVPFAHEDMEMWEDSKQFGMPNHFNTLHEETNILFGGGLDDVWQNKETGELHIVDYKSTAGGVMGPKREPKPVSVLPPENPKIPDYKASYRRQMDMYQFIARKMGFEVSDTGYFLYVDGQHWNVAGMLDEDPATATMKFNATILTYIGDDSWVDQALRDIKAALISTEAPSHNEGCEEKTFLDGVEEALSNG